MIMKLGFAGILSIALLLWWTNNVVIPMTSTHLLYCGSFIMPTEGDSISPYIYDDKKSSAVIAFMNSSNLVGL